MERIDISAEDAERLRAQAEEEALERPALAEVMREIANGIELKAYEPYDKIRQRHGFPPIGDTP
ncbi:hypothetical protein AB0K80_30175 [Streptomyces sp. NPDC052682]|uniref:hypothetical protein n=1 Tax=Streptomyces sp. NPDC052682 TaxID=3154954 RepID=UPI00342B35EE